MNHPLWTKISIEIRRKTRRPAWFQDALWYIRQHTPPGNLPVVALCRRECIEEDTVLLVTYGDLVAWLEEHKEEIRGAQSE